MERVLACLDTSPRAPHVLSTAAEVARGLGGTLTLLRAIELPADLGEQLAEIMHDDTVRRLEREAEAELQGRAAALGELVASVEARTGKPWEVICDRARELGAELIVIGSHGFGPLDVLLGTTAANVVNHAPCSVLVARLKP